MKLDEKMAIGMYVFGAVVFIAGVLLMLSAFGWRGLLGVVLLLWGNNIGIGFNAKLLEERREREAAILGAMERVQDQIDEIPKPWKAGG